MRSNSRFTSLILILALAAFALAGAAMAQVVSVGTLGGQVKDETGAALPGASIAAVSAERGYSRTTVTDTTGRFLFSQTEPGRYKVTVSLSGFSTVTLTDNLVENQKKTDLAITLKLSAQSAEITVTGEVPIIDKTHTSLEMNQRSKEFEKLPQGRSFQSLFLNAPGVNLLPGSNPNPSVHGALSGNNLWLFDGADMTDTTTGTFANNLDFEAIQEVSVQTSGVSAEYGRATGGVINVITKSGTNTFAGSFKTVMTNDNWDNQNTTTGTTCPTAATCTHPSLARTKFDHLNPRYSGTLGGPFWTDHVWFFGAYEAANVTGAQQTTPVSGQNYQQTTHSKFWDAKVTAQITPSVAFNARAFSSPTSGFIVAYAFFASPGNLTGYTGQDQTAQSYAGFLTGVFGSNVTAEAQYNWNGPAVSSATHNIDVYPLAGASMMHYSQGTGFQFNGPTFDGYVSRPRQGALGAVNYFTELGGNSHSFKAGVDYQKLTSASQFGFLNNQIFIDRVFPYQNETLDRISRRDYVVPLPSISTGNIIAVYARDKFEIGKHIFMELGLRYEHQKSDDDINRITINAGTWSPRAAISYDVFGTGKSLVVGTYGRFYQFVLQSFSDGFGQNSQQSTYDNYNWNGTAYVFSNHVSGAGSSVLPPTDLRPTYNDEGTLGYRQQIGNSMGIQVTGIYRNWGGIIDDIPILDGSGNQATGYVNYKPAMRNFWGAEMTIDKRFSEHWNANLSYAWGKTTSNTDSNFASSLGDYLNSNCRTTIDPTVGTLPCATVVQGPNKTGQPTLSINNAVKAAGAYSTAAGPVNLSLGMAATTFSGIHFQKQRSVNVLIPGTTTNAGPTETYLYEPKGTETTPQIYSIDTSIEATYTIWKSVELGFKGEVFNVTNTQKQVTVNNTTWCGDATQAPTTSCSISRANFGAATARGSYQGPRAYRITGLVRF